MRTSHGQPSPAAFSLRRLSVSLDYVLFDRSNVLARYSECGWSILDASEYCIYVSGLPPIRRVFPSGDSL